MVRLKTGLVAVAAHVAAAAAVHLRDYDARDYFVVELDTATLSGPLARFKRDHPEYSYEEQLFDNHYVFLVAKSADKRALLGDWFRPGYADLPVGHTDTLDTRELSDEHPARARFEANPQLRLVELVRPLRIQKRAPVALTEDEAAAFNRVVPRFEVTDLAQQPIKDAMDAFGIADPLFPKQWHLVNTYYPGNDVNVTGVWAQGIAGKGVTACVIDDGLDGELLDLKDNFDLEGSWDFNNPGNTPWPRLDDDTHGTRCAGEIAAVRNDQCGVGVAFNALVAGVRILSGALSLDQEALAMRYKNDHNDIYLCSWGPTDNGRTMQAPPNVVRKAMIDSVQKGRGGKGLVYVFALGNGAFYGDLCNFDGYTNLIYLITVGAIDYKGQHPYYLELCTAVMCVTYLGGSGEHIHTTDVHGTCLDRHLGTLAAAPLAAGIFALALQVNPELTWRDLQYCVALLAVPVNEDNGDYQETALGPKFSLLYGFGKIDSWALVEKARTWKNVNPQAWMHSDVATVNEKFSQEPAKFLSQDKPQQQRLTLKITVTKDDMAIMNMKRVEHVTVLVNIGALHRGYVAVKLTLPLGRVLQLATFRGSDKKGTGFPAWTFMSVVHWGEDGVGEWELEVTADDLKNTPVEVELENWQLRLWGESDDAKKAEEFEFGRDYAEVRRVKLAAQEKPEVTETAEASPVETHDTPADTKGKPEVNHPTAKPEEEKEKEKGEKEKGEGKEEGKEEDKDKGEDKPEKGEEPEDKEDKPEDKEGEDKPDKPDSDSDSDDEDQPPQPSTSDAGDGSNKQLTVDHTGQYFMALAVVGFIVVVAFMKFHKTPGSGRRKRRRRDDYEFDIIPGEDYLDSEDDGSDDLVNLHQHNARDMRQDEQRLYDELNADVLPTQGEEMFSIGGDDDEPPASPHKKDAPGSPETPDDSHNGDDLKPTSRLLLDVQ